MVWCNLSHGLALQPPSPSQPAFSHLLHFLGCSNGHFFPVALLTPEMPNLHLPTLSLKQIFLAWVLPVDGVGSLASFIFLALAFVAVLFLVAATALSFSFATICSSTCTAVVAASVLVTASAVVSAPAVVAASALASLLLSSFLMLSSSALSVAAVASTFLVESWIETSATTTPCTPPAPLASSVSPGFPRAASLACPWESVLLTCSTASTISFASSPSWCLVSVLECWIGLSLAFVGSSWSVTDGEDFGSSCFFSPAARLCSRL